MALWGNQDSKTASGTVSISSAGVVTGTSTAFTTQAKVGNTIKAGGVDYQIIAITSDTAATVIMGKNNGNGTVTTASGASYTLSEKPASVAHESSTKTTGQAAGRTGDSNKVFGVDTTEMKAGGDNIVEIAVATGATRYLEAPAITVAAPTAITVATTAVTTATSTITITTHKYLTGTKLTYSAASGTVLGGLTDATAYYVITVDANTIKLASSLANAQAGTAITLTGTGNSSQTFTGDTATATSSITAGAVSSVTVTNVGSAYLTVPAVTVAKPIRTIPTTSITVSTDTIAYTTHGLVAGDAVKYFNGGGASATGLTSATTYYVATAGFTTGAFEVKAANTTGTLTATVAVSGTAGQFTCGNSTLAVGDRVTITGTNTGTATGVTAATYKVSAVTGTSPSVTGFTLTTEAAGALTTTAGTLVSLTYTTETVIDITGTGNAAQYFELQAAADQATATASFGTGQSSVAGVTHAGWVRRTVGTGGRAGRVFYETLVAGGTISGDQSDNIQFPNS
jgi:hypothetical protein